MITLILLVFAFVIFLIAAFNVPFRLNLVALGLAFWVAAELFGRKLIPLIAMVVLLSSCAQLNGVNSWIGSPQGMATLGAVATTASVFAPQYAGVISLAVYGLEAAAGTKQVMPTVPVVQNAIASATGGKANDPKVTALATAIVGVAASAPSPSVGLSKAAATINSTAAL